MEKVYRTVIIDDEESAIDNLCFELQRYSYILVEGKAKTGTLGLKIMTLSKILCKWKQDSVVSLFLYLNSVFKHKHKLIHNQAPV